LLLAGCSNDKADTSEERMKSMTGNDTRKLVPVSGKVTVDGQPTGGVSVILFPDPPAGVVANETLTKPDGTYCLITYGECDGIPAGKYKVTFKLIPKPGRNDNATSAEDKFKGKFADPNKSSYKLEVTEGSPKTDGDFDLKTK